MRRGSRFFLGGALVVLALEAVIVLVVMYSGAYDVGAAAGESGFMSWVLSTTSDHSMESHGAQIQAPALDRSGMLETGFREYHEECQQCHGGPGVKPGEFAKGLEPDPPDLGDAAKEFSPGVLFWTAKHGIKFTGMPAFGATHPDSVLWAITAFVTRLPRISPQQYRAMVLRAESRGSSGEAGEASGDAERGAGAGEAARTPTG